METGKFLDVKEAKKPTLKELIDRYEKTYQEKISTAKQIAEIRWGKTQLGGRRLSDLNPILINEYKDRLQKEITTRGKRRSNGSVRRYLAVLSHLLNVAVKEFGWLQESPMSNGRVSKPKESRGRVRFLSDDERVRLLAACEDSSNKLLYPIVVLALSTGMRLGELIGLRWQDVDFERGILALHTTKNGERRIVPIKGLAFHLLSQLKEKQPKNKSLVFAGAVAHKPIDIRFSWETALQISEIKDFRFHDLRHTAASYLAMSRCTLSEIAEVLGHKTLSMVKKYAHLSEAHTGSVVARMNKKFLGQS